MNKEWMDYFRQIHAYLQQQNETLKDMSRELGELRQEWNRFRHQAEQPVKHEYKIDLLKVENLRGNLHIGIKPDGSGTSLEQLAVENETMELDETIGEDQRYRAIRREIREFFEKEAAAMLKTIEQKWEHPLDEASRHFVLSDVEKQVGERIKHYMNMSSDQDRSANELEQDIIDKVKKDIAATFETFIRNLAGEENT